MTVDSLLKIAKRYIDRLDISIDVPSEHLAGTRILDGVRRDVPQAAKLLLGEGLLDELERLRLLAPVQGLGQLVPRLDDVAVVGVEVLLQHDLRGDVGGRVGQRHAPDLGVLMCLGRGP